MEKPGWVFPDLLHDIRWHGSEKQSRMRTDRLRSPTGRRCQAFRFPHYLYDTEQVLHNPYKNSAQEPLCIFAHIGRASSTTRFPCRTLQKKSPYDCERIQDTRVSCIKLQSFRIHAFWLECSDHGLMLFSKGPILRSATSVS